MAHLDQRRPITRAPFSILTGAMVKEEGSGSVGGFAVSEMGLGKGE